MMLVNISLKKAFLEVLVAFGGVPLKKKSQMLHVWYTYLPASSSSDAVWTLRDGGVQVPQASFIQHPLEDQGIFGLILCKNVGNYTNRPMVSHMAGLFFFHKGSVVLDLSGEVFSGSSVTGSQRQGPGKAILLDWYCWWKKSGSPAVS